MKKIKCNKSNLIKLLDEFTVNNYIYKVKYFDRITIYVIVINIDTNTSNLYDKLKEKIYFKKNQRINFRKLENTNESNFEISDYYRCYYNLLKSFKNGELHKINKLKIKKYINSVICKINKTHFIEYKNQISSNLLKEIITVIEDDLNITVSKNNNHDDTKTTYINIVNNIFDELCNSKKRIDIYLNYDKLNDYKKILCLTIEKNSEKIEKYLQKICKNISLKVDNTNYTINSLIDNENYSISDTILKYIIYQNFYQLF